MIKKERELKNLVKETLTLRFRLIEKDGPGAANVGLDDQHIQGTEDSVIASESKTYIGSSTKKKVDMNKIKNTKIGDDIHYYVNGTEGRGVVVKMGSQYLDIFQQDGNVKTVNINDTFFVKDILINKQWDDMDDTERYVALQKIHAPTPRFIIKSWSALPEEIKDLLRKDGGLSGGSGSTYEEGETKDSETQDHARTGFAQNTQYSKKVESVEKKEDPQLEHHLRRKRTKEEKKTGVMSLGNPKYYTLDNPKWQGDKSKIPQPYSKTDYRTGVSTVIGGKGQWSGKERDLRHARRKFHKDDEKKMSEWEKEHERFNIDQDKLDAEQKELQAGGSTPTTTTTTTQVPPTPKNQEIEAQRRVDEAKKKPKETDTCPTCGSKHKKEEPKPEPTSKPSGGFVTDENDYKNVSDSLFEGIPGEIYKNWLDGRDIVKAKAFRKLKPVYEGDTKESTVKSDVEQGTYSNPGSTPEVGVSTDTKVDVPVSTGYEERPHISVEEAGKLPRSTFNPHGNDELHVRGSQDSKDQPKFNQPVSQSQPVRKVGAPEQHPNSYGVRYGMKGGVKKVWCPEHQVWEETTKDWHE